MTKNDDTQEIHDLFGGALEVIIGNEYSNRRRSVLAHGREATDLTANLAIKFAEHFGIVVGEPDGEDNSGRQKLKLMSPEAVVDRAVTMASLLTARLRADGHIALMPSLHEPEPKADENGGDE